MIPEHLIEQIAQANDIVDVISSYFPLKRAGSAYKARCPFHQEKTASFNVNPARQIFKCFGCGAGGGVFKFVELYENVNFPEAVKRLAAKAGIRVEEEPLTAEEDAKQKMRRRLLALHAAAAEWFHTNLLRTKAAQHARDYLKSRGLTGEVAKSWKLGYAPESWDALTNWARSEGYRDDELIASGLVTVKEDEEGENHYTHSSPHFYDRFRDRLMFPICNDIGEVIAFSGRVLSKEAFGGKYVNSPETPLFVKGNVLFGIHKTKRALIDKKAAIVCEGQIDLITAFEAGVQNVTAPQGTAFTPQQARILKRFADEVILCFDSDAAGLKAAERSLPALLEANLAVRVAEMPAGHDPDSLIRSEGAEAFIQQIAQARDFFDFQIARAVATPEFATPKGKAAFARKMAESVALVADPVLREAIIRNITAQLEITSTQFVALINEALPRQNRLKTARQTEDHIEAAPRLAVMTNTTRGLCRLALVNSQARDWLSSRPWENLFSSLPDGDLLLTIMRGKFDPSNPASVGAFIATCNNSEQSALAEIVADQIVQDRATDKDYLSEHARIKIKGDPLRWLLDCWRDMERRQLELKRDAINARIRTGNPTPSEEVELYRQSWEIQQQINAMRA
ncbi:MAG: DNA primase [Verrucomicrobia bacterium]|nr:DNA primase [Verrucomicrobiota bacterium]